MKKKLKKRRRSLFWRSFFYMTVLILAPVFILLGMSRVYEAVKLSGFAQRENAIEITRESDGAYLKLFDFKIKIISDK